MSHRLAGRPPPKGSGPPGRVTMLLRRVLADPVRRRRLWRYVLTSVVATLVSETALLVLYGTGALDAGVAAVVANLAGTLPSYLMSRYWIWPEADRRRVGRQVVLYWAVSVVSLVVSSTVTGVAADQAPAGRLAHLLVVAIAYVATYGALWLAKFAVYQLVLFRPVAVAPQGGFDVASAPPGDRPAPLR